MSVDDRLRAQLAEISQARDALREDQVRLKGGGSDGTSGGVTDDWKASVDRQLVQLHDDVRRAETRLVAAAIALAAMIAGLYLYTNEKFDRIGQRLSAIEVQQARIDAKLDRLIERIPPPRK